MKFSEGYSFGFTTNSSSNWSPVAPHRGMRRSVQWLPFFICWALCPVLTGAALPHLTTLGGCFPPLYRRRQVRDVESFAQDRHRHATSERWKWDSNPRVAAEPEHRSSRPRSVPVKLSTARQCQERLVKSALWVPPSPSSTPSRTSSRCVLLGEWAALRYTPAAWLLSLPQSSGRGGWDRALLSVLRIKDVLPQGGIDKRMSEGEPALHPSFPEVWDAPVPSFRQ